MTRIRTVHIRAAKELKKLITEIQIEELKKGRKPPTAQKVTKAIVETLKKLDKGNILYHEIIKIR